MNPPLKTSGIVAKGLLLLSLICFTSIFLINGRLAPSIAQSNEERVFEDTTSKHLPIKVKIKKEKEKAFKDLKNEHWARDLEIEVTNTGDKPIYVLHFTLDMPDIIDESGYHVGLVLHYGRGTGDIETKAEPDEIPIKPGETYVFHVSRGQVLGWESYSREHNKIQPKKLILSFGILTFGDGTGFWGADGIFSPNAPEKKSSLKRCEPGPNKSDQKAFESQQAC